MDSDKISESIKKAAQELFRRYGYNKTSVNEIAQKARIAKATLYKYYDSKELILHSILMEYLERSISELVNNFSPQMDDEVRLSQLILKTSRISFTATNEFIGWDFIRESMNAQEFLKKFSNELEDLLFEAFSKLIALENKVALTDPARLRFLINSSKSIVFSYAFTSVSLADVKKNFIRFRKEILPYLVKGALS